MCEKYEKYEKCADFDATEAAILTLNFEVTVDLQGCLPKNLSHARLLCYNHKKVYIIVKVIKFKIRRINFLVDLI